MSLIDAYAKTVVDQGDKIKAQADEIERLREALLMWDALIQHKYNGSRQAMNDMTDAAQHTAQVLYGDPPWPDPKPALQQKESE